MAEASPPRQNLGLRVLVVEDEMLVALLLQEMLAVFGCAVVGPVGRLQKAIDMAKREALDLAILDVNINGREVYPVAEVLAARGIPFVFATGYGKGGLRPTYRDCPTLQKPFREYELRMAVESVTSEKS